MGTLTGLFNNMGLSTFIPSVFSIIDINFGGSFYCIILFAINGGVIPPLNSEFIVSAFVPLICCTHNLPSSKSEELRSFSLGEKRVPYRPGSKCSAHSNTPR
jgi:hypothetical protein